eukprot:Skav214302  [mRNA]  locus=scaffold4614:71304:73301:- [translate_table: standard]
MGKAYPTYYILKMWELLAESLVPILFACRKLLDTTALQKARKGNVVSSRCVTTGVPCLNYQRVEAQMWIALQGSPFDATRRGPKSAVKCAPCIIGSWTISGWTMSIRTSPVVNVQFTGVAPLESSSSDPPKARDGTLVL